MRALVTGAAGFVGGHLTAELVASGAEVIGPNRAELDMLDAEGTRRAIAAAAPYAVFHLAALASVGESARRPEGDRWAYSPG